MLVTSLNAPEPIDLSGITALQNIASNTPVTFRIVNYGGSSSAGTWYIYNTGGDANPDLELRGTIFQIIDAPEAAPPHIVWFEWSKLQMKITQNVNAHIRSHSILSFIAFQQFLSKKAETRLEDRAQSPHLAPLPLQGRGRK